MSRRNRTVHNELRVDSYTINDILVNYLENRFYVNRRYQRKLVWSLEDKRLLIDSILNNIPLPAVLIAQYELADSKTSVLEIVDGMQRLDAIISFMLGKFAVKYNGEYCYYDPFANSDTFNLVREGKLEQHDKVLPKEVCRDFYRYQIPAIITGQDDEMIELIFSRINSTGRKITAQDLRQSRATGEFPDLVRRIASRVRGDYTYDDRVCLCDMYKISVGQRRYGYGVDIDSVFWRRHDLINKHNIVESKDEELIETIAATVLLQDRFRRSKDSLDDLYDANTQLGAAVEDRVAEIGKDVLENKFADIFDQIDMIFDSVHSDFSSYLFDVRRVSNKDECFKVVFLALYALMSDGYTITDFAAVAEAIRDAKPVFEQFTRSGLIKYDEISKASKNLYKLLKSSFSYNAAHVDDEFTKELDKRLSYSRIERQMTEFKIGVSDFRSSTFNLNVIADVAKTLVAMSNVSNAREEGLVIIGIADNRQSYINWNSVFRSYPAIVNQHYVTGVSCEAKKLCGNTDSYYRKLRRLFENEPISSELKKYILETFEVVNYHDTEVVVFRSKSAADIGVPSLYDGVKYVRHSSETVKV